MLLTADIGNTTTGLALFNGDEISAKWRINTEPRRTGDELGLLLLSLLEKEGIQISRIGGFAISSVVPRLDAAFETASAKYLRVPPLFFTPNLRLDMPIRVEKPQYVGSDRLVGALAALRIYGMPVVVVDFGTATTFNVVSKDGEFLGGAVAPGIAASLESLVRNTALLPLVPFQHPPSAIGKDTLTALQAGLVLGYAGLVEGLVYRIWREVGRSKVIATGGFAPLIASETELFDTVDSDLTLKGLKIFYDLNCNEG